MCVCIRIVFARVYIVLCVCCTHDLRKNPRAKRTANDAIAIISCARNSMCRMC